MKPTSLLPLAALAFAVSPAALRAGSYNQNFNAFANGVTNLGDGSFVGSNNGPASVQGQRLRLTLDGTGSTQALYRLGDLDAGSQIAGFDVQFDMAMSAAGTPADGVSLSFGALPLTDAAGPGEEGYQLPGGMVISFDTYINNPPETTRTLDVRIDGNQLVSIPESGFGNYNMTGTTVHVTMHWDASGLDVIYGSFTVCNNLAVPGLLPNPGDRFAWSARTGGAFESVFLDNVVVSTTPTAPITRPNVAISEVLVDNTAYDDEHCQSPGWVELYNGTAAAVSLNGWSLTDDAGTPGKWPFPASQNIPAYGYVLVWLGHDTPAPTAPDTTLHTNFTLPKPGGFLGLFQGATQIDGLTCTAQFEDVSYGFLDHAWTPGFLETTTPGTRNRGVQESNGPITEEIVWPRDGGLITGPIAIELGALTTPGAEIRYTLDNTLPTPASLLYTAPINVTTSTNIRARAYAPGYLPGPVSGKTFLKLHSSVTNYRGTGQPFSSNLPIIVIDSFGRSLDSENSATPGARPFRPTYNVVLAPDPANGNRTIVRETKHDNDSDAGAGVTRAPVDFQGRSGMHVRGESSSGMPQRQYAWETWDSEDGDKNVSILGFPAESDWILYAPSTDKTLLRNYIAYSTMFDTNGESSAMRTRFVEVFFNQPALSGVSADTNPEITYGDYRGVYVLVEKIKRGNDRVDISKLDPCDTDPSLITGGYIFKKDKVSVDPDFTTANGQILQIIEPETTVNSPHWTWLRNHVNAFESALYGPNYTDPVLGYRAYIDELSFQDNEWWVEIFKQIDGYRLSTYFYKDRGQKIKSAPLWDYNLSGGNADYLAGWNYNGWYRDAGISSGQTGDTNFQYYWKLRQDSGYILRLWDRYWKLRQTTFDTGNLMARVDTAVAELTDSQAAANMKNSLNWDITNWAAAGNTPQLWPNSVPSVEVPAARHHARWQRLGIYDWPNAAGRDERDYYASSADAANYTAYTTAPYNITTPPAMSEVVHYKAYMTNRLKWIDDAYLAGSTIVRPPVFSQAGGPTAPFTLTISAYGGTPPPAANYGLTGSLSYMGGLIYYTTNGSDPISGGGTQYNVLRTFVSDTQPVQATVPSSAAANADTAGKDWKATDFNHLSTPAGVTWYAGINGVGYDDGRTTGINFFPHLNLIWNTTLFNFATAPPGNAGIPAAPVLSNVMRSNQLINGTTYPGNPTCYIRLPFTLTAGDIAGLNSLQLSAKYDDGFIAWLNGTKIAEKNPPVAAPAWNSFAGGLHDDTASTLYESIPLLVSAPAAVALLVEGPNVLAIQGLNQSASSNDCLQRFLLRGEAAASPITINSTTTVKARLYDSAANRWSPLTEATYTVDTVPASSSNLVISEIMYNPTEPTAAEINAGFNNDNMFEYLEIQNISSQTVDMAGVSFPNGFTFNWPTSDANLRVIGPGQRAVIVGHLGAFNYRYAPGPGVKIAGVFDGNLGNGGEHLVMAGTLGVIKDFTYDEDPPWPAEPDGAGYSLVLNNPVSNPDHNLAVNWRASFEINGTPGAAAGPAGPDAASALLDDDGDGMTNLMEHAAGTSSSDGGSQSWPSTGYASLIVPPATTPEDYLTFSYTRGRAADGFSYAPLVSTALTGWQPLSSMFTLVSQINNPDGTATLTWRSTNPASTLPPRIFLQVQATLNP